MEYFSLSTGFYQKFRLQTQILLFESLFLKNDYIKQLQLKNMNFQFELQLRRKFKICQSNNSNLFAFSQKKVKCTCFLLFQKIVLEKVFKIYCGIPVCLLVPAHGQFLVFFPIFQSTLAFITFGPDHCNTPLALLPAL